MCAYRMGGRSGWEKELREGSNHDRIRRGKKNRRQRKNRIKI